MMANPRSRVETEGGAIERASRVLAQTSRMADLGNPGAMSGCAHRVGRLGDLLRELALAGAASGFGGRVRGVCDLGVLAGTPTAHVQGRARGVSWRGRVVDLDCSLARSHLAAGSRRDA